MAHAAMDHSMMDHSMMDHSGMDHGDMGGGHGGMDDMCSMNMLFTWDTTNLCIISKHWHIRSNMSLVLSLLAIVALTAGYEYLRFIVARKFPKNRSSIVTLAPLTRTARPMSALQTFRPWLNGDAASANQSTTPFRFSTPLWSCFFS